MAGWLQLAVLVGCCSWPPTGRSGTTWRGRSTSPRSLRVERAIYRLAGRESGRRAAVDRRYATSLLAFSLVSVLFLYVLQRVQASLPLSLGFPGVRADQAFNTAASFVSNTNWQSYAGESTMGHLVQMAGLAVQNFVSAAVGIAVAVALIRGFTRVGARRSATSGRISSERRSASCCRSRSSPPSCSCRRASCRTSTGPARSTTVQGATQSIPGGPVASQEAIKELGTNGGGFYNANSAHPFENPESVHEPARDRRCCSSSRSPSPGRSASSWATADRVTPSPAVMADPVDRLGAARVALRVAAEPAG